MPRGAHEAERLAAGADEPADRGDSGLLHRLEQELVGPSLRGRRAGHEEVGPVHPDRVDVTERDEALDVDGARVVVALQRLQLRLLDDHVLALRDLPALDDLVGGSSRSCIGHQRFCLMGERHSRCSSRKETSDWRAAGFVAGASPTGMLTRPKLSDPFQVTRMILPV